MDLSGNHIHNIYEVIHQYQQNINGYTDNIREYNTIINMYMTNQMNTMNPPINQYINPHSRNPFVNYNTRETRDTRDTRENTINRPNRNRINNPYSYIYTTPRTLSPLTPITTPLSRTSNNIFQAIRNHFEDVVVRPTAEQIENALETFSYTPSTESQTCPITLEPIQEGEEVCRIRHCSHLFKKTPIHGWFQRNVRCPVCRYDIREYSSIRHQEQQPETDDIIEEQVTEEERQEFMDLLRETQEGTSYIIPEEQQQRNISSNNLTGIFTNALRSFVNQELQRLPVNSATTELIYTFDLPVEIDPSGNYRL